MKGFQSVRRRPLTTEAQLRSQASRSGIHVAHNGKETGFSPVLRYFPVSITLSLLQTRSFVCHRYYTSLATDDIVKTTDGTDRYTRNVGNYQCTLRDIPEEYIYHIHRGGRLRHITSTRHFTIKKKESWHFIRCVWSKHCAQNAQRVPETTLNFNSYLWRYTSFIFIL